MKLTVIVPAYNEEENIARAIDDIETLQIPFRLIVVNDSSRDRTAEVVRRKAAEYGNIQLINRKGKRGVGRCLNRAFEEVDEGVVTVVMADLADDIRDIPRMMAKIEEGHDVVCGSRYIPGGAGRHDNRLKGGLSWLLGRALKLLAKLPTHDATNAFKMYRVSLIDDITPLLSDTFTTGLEITVRAFRNGYRVTEIPTRWQDRSFGASSFKILKVAPEYIYWFLWALLVSSAPPRVPSASPPASAPADPPPAA